MPHRKAPLRKVGKTTDCFFHSCGRSCHPRELGPRFQQTWSDCASHASPTNRKQANAQEVYQALQNILIDRPIQLVSGRAQDHVINRIEEHVSTIEKWHNWAWWKIGIAISFAGITARFLKATICGPRRRARSSPGDRTLCLCLDSGRCLLPLWCLLPCRYGTDLVLAPALGITFSLASAAWVVEGTIQHRIRPLFLAVPFSLRFPA